LRRPCLLDLGDDLLERLTGEQCVSFQHVVAVANRELVDKLVDKADSIGGPELSAAQLNSPLRDFRERPVLHGHYPISASSQIRT
jgi:hypothetical protein